MNNNLNFKFGQYTHLPNASTATAGTIFVTTDEQAMYIDLPSVSDPSKVGRIRIGDIIVCETLSDLKPPYHEGAFYYVASKNALLRYQPKYDGDGKVVRDESTGEIVYTWTQINSLSAIQQAISELQVQIDALGDADDEILAAMDLLLPIATFTEFQTQYNTDLSELETSISDTATEIREEIDTAIEEVNAAIGGVSDNLGTVQENLQGQINNKVETSTYNTKIGEIEGSLSELGTSISETATAIRGEISAAIEEVNASIGGVSDDLADATEDLQGQINDKVSTDTYNAKIGEIEGDIEGLSGSISETATEIRGEISAAIEEVNASIGGVSDDLADATEDLQGQINDKVSASDYNTKIGEIEGDINELGTSISETATEIRGEISAAIEEVNASIGGVSDDLTAATEDLQGQIDARVETSTYNTKIGEIEGSLGELGTSISDTATEIREEISAAVEEVNASIGGVSDDLEEAVIDLQEQINGKVSTDTYTTKIGEIEDDIDKLGTSISETEGVIRGEIEAAVEEINAAIGGVSDDLEEAVKNLQGQIDNKVETSTYSTKIKEIEDDIGELGDSISTTAGDIRGEIKTAVDAINASIDDVKDTYLKRDGSLSITGDLTFNTSGTIKNVADPVGLTDVANRQYVDNNIAAAIAGVNAMTLKNSISAEGDLPKAAAKPQTGDTYIVASAQSFITTYKENGEAKDKVDAKIGDLFINTAPDNETPVWVHVASGYNENYLQKFTKGQDTVNGETLEYIAITDGIGDGTANEEGRIYFKGSSNTNLNFTVTPSGTNDFVVTASLTWGTFDPEPEPEPESGVLPGEPQ